MSLTSARLKFIAGDLEIEAGVANVTNANDPGYWKRIALALEEIAGGASAANDNQEGYMLRSCVALETISTVVLTGYSREENGYIARMIASLEDINNDTYTGSLSQRLLLAVTGYVAAAHVLYNGEFLTVAGEPLHYGTGADVELLTALTAEGLTLSGGNTHVLGTLTVDGASTLTGAATFSAGITANFLASADGADGVLWEDASAAHVVKVSIP